MLLLANLERRAALPLLVLKEWRDDKIQFVVSLEILEEYTMGNTWIHGLTRAGITVEDGAIQYDSATSLRRSIDLRPTAWG